MGHLKQLVTITFDMLVDYNPKIQRHDKMSQLLSFWGRLVIFQNIPIINDDEINKGISTSNLEFKKNGTIILPNKYVKAINISTWGETCDL